MSDIPKAAASFVGSIFPSLPPDVREIIGVVIVMGCLFAIPAVPLYVINLATGIGKQSVPCWEMTEVQGVVFRLNKCTGEAQQIVIMKEPAATPKP
jgi:hypothetical protein